MPWRPRSHRPVPTRQRDYQEEDARRQQDPALALAKRLRSSARWQHVRAIVLAQQPLCADPFGVHARSGRIEPATDVDHIAGLRERPDLAFDPGNLMPCCHPCHARKTAGERRAGR